MNTITKTHAGHWSDSARAHSDASSIERFLELDDEAKRSSKGNAPMLCSAAVVFDVVLFPILLVGVGWLVRFLLQL